MFNLTQEERRVILFLVSVAVVGGMINFLAKKYSSIKTIPCLTQEIGKVNLNKADKDLLVSIPGIGEKLAQRIIEYRKLQGNFNSLQDLKKIKGINAYRYEKIKDTLFVK